MKEIIGATALGSLIMPRKKKHRRMMPKMGTAATLVGIGVGAYLAYKNQMDKHDDDLM
jgi:hypothetical protein